MTILILENASTGFRGEMTRWLLEVKAGVYIGNISKAVRDRLWDRIRNTEQVGAAVMIYSAQTEQGFAMEMCHTPERSMIDMEGITLIKRSLE